MGQHLSSINSQIVDLINPDRSTFNPHTIAANIGPEDVTLFLSSETASDTIKHEYRMSKQWIRQIQNYLYLLSNIPEFEIINAQIDNIFISIMTDYKQTVQEMTNTMEKREQLKMSFLRGDTDHKPQASFMSILANLFKSTEKHGSTKTHHSRSLKKDSAASNHRLTEGELDKILHDFLTSNISLKDVLSVLDQLIFDTVNIYDTRSVFTRFNDRFIAVRSEWEKAQNTNTNTKARQTTDGKLLDHLTSMEAFPNTRLRNMHKKQCTGQFISTFLFIHIDFHNTINANKQFNSGSLKNSMSFDFHPNTFKQLFHIIKQLRTILTEDLNINLVYILIICLRLFTVHLKFLLTITTNPFQDLSLTNDDNIGSNHGIDFISNEDLQTWFDTLLPLACHNDGKHEQITICREVSKAFVHIFNKKVTFFTFKLSFIYKYVIENKHFTLIRELLIDLNTNTSLLNWIEVLCDNKSDNKIAFDVLYSFIDIYFNPPNEMKPKIKQQIQEILLRFQQLVFARLATASSLASKYIKYIFNNFHGIANDLFNSIFIGLSLMTETYFTFEIIQPIITSILPFFAELARDENLIANNLHYIYWLLGKMTYRLIVGSEQDALELKHTEKLHSPLFAGGCERFTIENNEYLSNLFESNIVDYSQFKITDYNLQQSSTDHEFLMLIYNNTNQGARLISKMKMHIKDKQHLVQKSIEQLANNACAALFAVYIKYYRRVNLAKYELSRTDDKKPHRKLLSVFEHANHVHTLFSKTKGQGGNCDELYEQIKTNTLFLLTSIKESNLIPIIECETNEQVSKPKLKRHHSRKTVPKHDFRLLRNTFQACLRFKKSILTKKKSIEEKQDNENVLKRAIDNYVFNEKKLESAELLQSMFRQYARAITRQITYQFSHKFIQKILDTNNPNQIFVLMRIYLPYLRKTDIEWTYLENISSTNIQLKEDISQQYYSIIKTILSYFLQPTSIEKIIIVQNLSYLLNLSYKLIDIYHLHNHQYLEILFSKFISSDLDVKFIIFNWFRLYVFKLCENFQTETNQIQQLIFGKIILNELKPLTQETKHNSLNNMAIEPFMQQAKEIDSYINQYLILLLRCVHLFEHVRLFCVNHNYIEELVYIYQHSNDQITVLLSLRILREIITLLPEDLDGQAKLTMNHFLTNSLSSIKTTTIDITTELIYIYRIIMSYESPWQIMAIQIISHIILKSFESIDHVLAALCVLGGYIQPFCLGSVVEINLTDGIQIGVIIDIQRNASDSDVSDGSSYLVQFVETNKIERIAADKLRVKTDVLPPALLELPDANEFINLLFDALVHFIQIDTSTIEPLLLLQLKRRSITVLYRILNHKKLVDIFMEKSYVSVIAKLSTSALLSKAHHDLHLLNKHHLEQYCLSLDRCEYYKQILDDTGEINTDEFIIWTDVSFKNDQIPSDFSSTDNWKSNMSKKDLQLFKQGRFGSDEIKIIPMPSQPSANYFIEVCGMTHRFPGQICLISENANALVATFIVDKLQLSQGNWYFCVRLLEGTSAQIGWATNGFKPTNSLGIGNDKYSWSYDGSQGMIYNTEQYPFLFDNIRWSTNDVCGCGIEIDHEQIRINYWLNGHSLGTAFAHQFPIDSTTMCDMLPNEYRTNYFPGVSLKVNDSSILSSCEFIFDPMDMFECPLPKDYKPLVVPKLIDVDDSLVAYPFSAYLIGENPQDYFIPMRNKIRDFINDHHLESAFTLENQQLILSEESGGFPLAVDYDDSLTVSFDCSILKISNDYLDIPLLTFNTADPYSIRIPRNKMTNKTQIAMIFQPNERTIKIYINNECRTFEIPIITNFDIHILPSIAVGIHNLAIWKYALSEEHIRRLFTSGLSYIATDYYRLNEYQKQMNTVTFNSKQKYFQNGLLIPFNENKLQADENESTGLKINNEIMLLFGNKSFLVLNKSVDPWSEYTFIFDISIIRLPIILITLNQQTQIYITYDGQLCVSLNNERNIQSESKLKANECIRLLISVEKTSLKIYVNGLLKLDASVDSGQLTIKDELIELFKAFDSIKSAITDNTLRIECKSITYLNKALIDIDEQMKSPNTSLESLVTPSYSILSPSLIRIGYDESSIKSAMKQTMTTNIQLIDTILRGNYQQHDETILSKLGSSIDKEKLKSLLQFDSEENLSTLAEVLLLHWNDIRTIPPSLTERNWFHQTIDHLNLNENLTEWIRDKSTIAEQTDLTYQLHDLNQSVQVQTTTLIDDQWKKLDRHITRQKYHQSRIACEHGLISIYSHYIILNILRIWSNDGSSLFPLEKLGDWTFIVTLLRLLDTYTRLHKDETIDRMSLLINSILKLELNQLIKYRHVINNDTLLYHLQRDIMTQSIEMIFHPSLYNDEYDIKKPNLNFILKLVNLFVKLISEKSMMKQDDVDLLVPLLFPEPLINILFDLFLVTPINQTKSDILHLFSALIQTSPNFTLNKNTQHFLFHLFLQLPPNSTSFNTPTMRTFQIAIMDLVFLLTKTNITNESFTFPQNFYDLLTTMNVIDALTDKTKQTPFPEMFPIQSIVLFGDNLQFTRDDIEKSNVHFDTTADLQLITFMNNNLLLKLSFIEFINSLPTDSIPSPTYYKIYPSLCHIPSNYIQIRAKLFYQLNIYIDKLVSLLDLSLFPGQSILTDRIQKMKSYILYETKSRLFSTTVTITALETNNDMPTVNFDTVQSTQTMFEQAYEQLHNNAHISFRKEYNQVWRAQYLAMHSTDEGGPFRDSVTHICSDICSTRSELFILCPNGRTNSGLNDDRWIPNIFPPNELIPNRIKKQYQFIGQLMGMAIRKKHYLDLKFPILLWKQLVRERTTIEDIENIDIQSFTLINEMEKINTNEMLSEILDELHFEIISSDGQAYELVPNGKNIPITGSNLKDYCSSYREYRLNEFYRQIECIRQGLYSVIPGYFLGLFTANELEEMVCGKGEMDVELLKRNTEYAGHYNQDSPCIQRFWTILRELFNEEQKKLFLKFVWGRCTLPSCDDDFVSKFRIEPYVLPNGLVDGALPRAHTCTFVLDLPNYSSIDIMYDRLNYAITYCLSIDGDGNMNEAPVPNDSEAGWTTDEQ